MCTPALASLRTCGSNVMEGTTRVQVRVSLLVSRAYAVGDAALSRRASERASLVWALCRNIAEFVFDYFTRLKFWQWKAEA